MTFVPRGLRDLVNCYRLGRSLAFSTDFGYAEVDAAGRGIILDGWLRLPRGLAEWFVEVGGRIG